MTPKSCLSTFQRNKEMVKSSKKIKIKKIKKLALNALYDYPEFTAQFERKLISVSILDNQNRIIGCAVFNDYP